MEFKKCDSRGFDQQLSAQGIYKFKDSKMVTDPYLQYNFSSSNAENRDGPAIVIDNGKYLPNRTRSTKLAPGYLGTIPDYI